MSKKILLGGLFTLFLLIILLPKSALAAAGDCHLKHCYVPAPTILDPGQGGIVNTQRPGIAGLTWKTTVVKVYIDGIEMPNVKQIKHEDYYGSFYVEPDFNLTPGVHYVYTIAQSEKPSLYDQSQESIYISFTVELPPAATYQPVLPANQTETTPPSSDEIIPELPATPIEPETDNIISQVDNLEPSPTDESLDEIPFAETNAAEAQSVEIINSAEDNTGIEVEYGQIEGGVSVEQEREQGNYEELSDNEANEDQTSPDELGLQGAAGLSDLGEILQDEFVNQEAENKAKRNRTIGLSILALIIVASIIWLAADKERLDKNIDKDGELPPPPAPIKESKNQARPASRSEAGKIDKIIDNEVTPPPIEPALKTKEYFAAPPSSPHSPYPSQDQEPEYMPVDNDNNDQVFESPEEALKEIEDRYIAEVDQADFNDLDEDKNKLL